MPERVSSLSFPFVSVLLRPRFSRRRVRRAEHQRVMSQGLVKAWRQQPIAAVIALLPVAPLGEAGEGEDGRIKSAVGVGALLSDGIGDTVRISLTEKPINEIPVALKLVNHFKSYQNHEPITAPMIAQTNPFEYERRDTRPY